MKLEDLKESKWKKKKKERLKIRMSYRTSKCCNGATELTAPRYTVIVQWLTYRLRIAPGLQVPFGGITDSQHPPADASAEIDGKTETSRKVSSRFLDPIDIERSLESNLTRFGPTTNRKIC
ncbi:hypothetical protein HZH66_006520 [Vespula vulgaris]|uniref:Uncharacterized protein n=1 Tax=Vespula vulgaris TaxID=7454 RepID=A0A834K1X2_VESVU|nr:hypothetical protein HZH66_006520 [Vespula vulgaris]